MRMLHTMLRVGDMERSVKFYTEVMGMKLLRTTDRPEQKYSLAFVGYGPEDAQAVIELAGLSRTYDMGGVPLHALRDVTLEIAYKACETVKAKGGSVSREAGPVKGGSTVIAFVQDPDGYKIELIERK